MSLLRFARENARWLGAGIALTWSSSFGQTFFISLSAADIRAVFGLSHAGWGSLYTLGTLASAVTLVFAGRLADRMRVRSLAMIILVAFAIMCVAMAFVSSWWMLVPIIFGLRFCGQGMMSHLAMTAMGRWFRGNRGRAIGIASLGFAVGEGLLPITFVTLSAWIGWRGGWLLAAGVLIFVSLPLLAGLLRQERTPQTMSDAQHAPGMGGRHWSRKEATQHWLFWALLPGVLAPSFIITSTFFYQVHLTTVKGWALTTYVSLYPMYSALAVCATLITGQLIDRYGTMRLLPFYLLPLALGTLLMGSVSAFWVAPCALIAMALTQGASQGMLGAIWPEYYGTRHLGTIRAMVIAGPVLASALGPGITGGLIDAGVGIEVQLRWMAMYLVGISVLLGGVSLKATAR